MTNSQCANRFLARAEFRRDWFDERFFPGRLGPPTCAAVNTPLLGGVWWFGNKQGAW